MNTLANSIKIAIVEDDVILREELCQFLQSHHFMVYEANNGLALNDILLNTKIDLIVLDLNLPGQSGLNIAQSIRTSYPKIGIVMLTARTGLMDRIKSYEHGADIYLPKPTPALELLGVINSFVRRLSTSNSNNWVLLTQSCQIAPPNDLEKIDLIPIEVLLLKALAQAPNYTLESESICEILSDHVNTEVMTKRSLENMISRLRKKIQPALRTQERRIIHSVWGTGYQLCLPLSIENH